MAVEVRHSTILQLRRPTSIPIERAVLGCNGRYYDITPDGKQFLAIMFPGAENSLARQPAERINIVLNWFEELKARVPTNN